MRDAFLPQLSARGRPQRALARRLLLSPPPVLHGTGVPAPSRPPSFWGGAVALLPLSPLPAPPALAGLRWSCQVPLSEAPRFTSRASLLTQGGQWTCPPLLSPNQRWTGLFYKGPVVLVSQATESPSYNWKLRKQPQVVCKGTNVIMFQ